MVPWILRLIFVWAIRLYPVVASISSSWVNAPPPPRASPAHLNCTVKRFLDIVLRGVTKQLHLSGTELPAKPSLSFHFDAGRSQPEGGGRKIPNETTILNTSQMSPPGLHCSADVIARCANAIGKLPSLEGLAEYLTDALSRGVAQPTPEHVAPLGWSPVQSTLDFHSKATTDSYSHSKKQPVELGGGSGAGFQIICDGKGLASLGGGGGGGASGDYGFGSAHSQRLGPNQSLGGGGGGGMQLAFPVNPLEDPWAAEQWFSWNSGGGSGCGSCKKGDKKCEASPHQISCGAKLDDNGAVNETAGARAAHLWRVSVLRRCFEAGRLAIIGGGGGGAGGAHCCKGVPTLNFGFGFHAKIKPGVRTPSNNFSRVQQHLQRDLHCCPDLLVWNVTNKGESSSGGDVKIVSTGRRLSSNVTTTTSTFYIDPFAMENTGRPDPSGLNRRPNITEMIKQHGKRFAADVTKMLNWTQAPTCKVPAWLNESASADELPKAWHSGDSKRNSDTKEPEKALKYIYKFNPLQGYLAEAAIPCGGWGDWCCLCHGAQRRIACLPEKTRFVVEWFLTEDCCESKLAKNTSDIHYVADATPPRNSTLVWDPASGWVDIDWNSSDSFHWHAQPAADLTCTMLEIERVHDARKLHLYMVPDFLMQAAKNPVPNGVVLLVAVLAAVAGLVLLGPDQRAAGPRQPPLGRVLLSSSEDSSFIIDMSYTELREVA